MNNKLHCPPTSIVADLLLGKMVEPELSELSAHLEQCAACQEKARTLPARDTLIESLCGEATETDRIALNISRPLLERLKEIPHREAEAAPEELRYDFLAPAQAADEIGRLGHYRVRKLLGRGGMGAVFLADDPKLERQVALKVMLPSLAANPRAKERFLREARAAARVKSDHIVTIYEVGEANGIPYLAMELLEGQSLDDLLRTAPQLDASQIIQMARDIARGLAAAHEKGLVHRDIKPGNLWVEGERVKILDFGLVRREKDDAHITQSGAVVGTPAYMAPEQAQGDKHADARADLFSLGCVLYRLCTGDVPFKAETTMGTLLAITLNEPAPLSGRNPSIPPELSRLIMQLLEKDPNRRPQSAREVTARLEEIRAAHGGYSRSKRSSARPLTPGVPSVRGSEKRQRRWLFAIAGLLFAGLVVAGAIYFWQMADGRVVRIECDDPAIKVAFANGELKVADAYKEPLTFKPGKVGLKVTRTGPKGDQFEFETDKFIVNRRDKIVLRIEVVEGKVQIVQAGKGVLDSRLLPVIDHERHVAEWVLGLGGKVKVNAENREIQATADLPREPFTLTTVNLTTTKVTDADLAKVRDLKRMTVLLLDGTKVTDAGLAHLKDCRGLEELYVDSVRGVTDAGLVHLKHLTRLKHLWLGGTKVTDDGLAHLTGLQKLVYLGLPHTAVTDTGMAHVKEFKDMAYLWLGNTRVTDAGLAHLKDFKRLIGLNVQRTKVTPQGLKDFHAAVPGCKIEHDGGVIERMK